MPKNSKYQLFLVMPKADKGSKFKKRNKVANIFKKIFKIKNITSYPRPFLLESHPLQKDNKNYIQEPHS